MTAELPAQDQNIFEFFADAFLEETGMLAPGKDQSAEMGGSPDIDQRAIRYTEWLQADNYKRAKQMRLAYAIHFTRESMAMCEVPQHIRDQEIAILKKQMAKLQEKQTFAESFIERYWHMREEHDFTWDEMDKEADHPGSFAPDFRREGF